jgi:hypothetical protein
MASDQDRPHPLQGRNKLLRVFIAEADKVHGAPLHEAILLAAREQGVAGVTVLRGVAAYGASSRLHTAKVLRLSEDLPLVLEIVDTEANIEAFLTTLHELLDAAGCGGLITMEAVDVIRYFPRNS